jgi:membrane-associated phospholipid phosphatase
VCFAYFIYFALACWYPKLPRGRRLALSAFAAVTAATIVVASGVLPPAIHDWAPLAYISLGYYISGWLFAVPSARLEAWLLAWDCRIFGDPTTRFAHWPHWLAAYLSIVYTFCFLLLPAGLVALIVGGHGDRADHYWTMVAAADLGAFAPLVAFQTRPPWQVERPAVVAAPTAHALASLLVRNATIGVNTFPSGHVAVSIAIGLAVVAVMPATGAVLLVLALSIAVACVVGRFHYAVDAVAGAAWSLLVWLLVTACGV